jgi:hypothetical protein
VTKSSYTSQRSAKWPIILIGHLCSHLCGQNCYKLSLSVCWGLTPPTSLLLFLFLYLVMLLCFVFVLDVNCPKTCHWLGIMIHLFPFTEDVWDHYAHQYGIFVSKLGTVWLAAKFISFEAENGAEVALSSRREMPMARSCNCQRSDWFKWTSKVA